MLFFFIVRSWLDQHSHLNTLLNRKNQHLPIILISFREWLQIGTCSLFISSLRLSTQTLRFTNDHSMAMVFTGAPNIPTIELNHTYTLCWLISKEINVIWFGTKWEKTREREKKGSKYLRKMFQLKSVQDVRKLPSVIILNKQVPYRCTLSKFDSNRA